MTILEAVDARRSRRTYRAEPIAPAVAEELTALISSYNKIGGFSMRLVLNNGEAFRGFRRSYGMFSGVQNYVGLIAKKDDPDSLEKLGYYGELWVLRATALGLGTCWVGGTFDRDACPFTLAEGERIACALSVGPVGEAMGMKDRLIRAVTHRRSKVAADMTDTDGNAPDWFWAGMAAVEKAPSAVNRQPVRFTCKGGVVTADVPDITDVGTALDFGIAKAHFALGAGEGTWAWGNGAAFAR